MFWILLTLPLSLFAQTSFPEIKELEDSLPSYQDFPREEDEIIRQETKYLPPKRVIKLSTIVQSGTQKGAIIQGMPLFDVETNQTFYIPELTYVNYFNLEDELGHKYIQGKDGSVKWKVLSRHVEPIKEELNLYVPPHIYTPAPKDIPRSNYDRYVAILPEVVFQFGMTTPTFMRELFMNPDLESGKTFIVGANAYTQWKLPIKVGLTLKYESTTYNAGNGGTVKYSSPSLGPIVKTKDFIIFDRPLRFYADFRLSPLATAKITTSNSDHRFKFNSTDLGIGLELPFKNNWGEFILGGFVQTQWLNIKDQDTLVNITASNKTNRLYGLSLSQVFE